MNKAMPTRPSLPLIAISVVVPFSIIQSSETRLLVGKHRWLARVVLVGQGRENLVYYGAEWRDAIAAVSSRHGHLIDRVETENVSHRENA